MTDRERYRANYELCHDCGGLCCALYLAHDENGDYVGEGWLPAYIDLWTERLVASGALRATADPSTARVKPASSRCTTRA